MYILYRKKNSWQVWTAPPSLEFTSLAQVYTIKLITLNDKFFPFYFGIICLPENYITQTNSVWNVRRALRKFSLQRFQSISPTPNDVVEWETQKKRKRKVKWRFVMTDLGLEFHPWTYSRRKRLCFLVGWWNLKKNLQRYLLRVQFSLIRVSISQHQCRKSVWVDNRSEIRVRVSYYGDYFVQPLKWNWKLFLNDIILEGYSAGIKIHYEMNREAYNSEIFIKVFKHFWNE